MWLKYSFRVLLLLCINFLNTTFSQLIPHELSHSLQDPKYIFEVDLNQDGFIDVLCSSSLDNSIVWFENLQDNTFATSKYITKYAIGVLQSLSGDIDNDGDMDVVSANPGDGSITWYENDGNQLFSNPIAVTNSSVEVSAIFLSDVDSDGSIDIVALFEDANKVSWFPNVGGVFGNEVIISNQIVAPSALTIGDINNDGWVDIVLCSNDSFEVYFFENSGTGSFSQSNTLTSELVTISHIALEDLDQDLDLDLFYSLPSISSIKMVLNNGSGGFATPLEISSASNPVFFDFVDIDNDALNDLIVSASGTISLKWQKNIGGNNFNSPISLMSQPLSSDIGLTDVSNDGLLDIIGIDGFNNTVTYFENEGNASFEVASVLSPDIHHPGSVCISDITTDMFPDIVYVTTESNEIGYFENNTVGGFHDKEVLFQADNDVSNIRSADIDNDGDLDLLAKIDQYGNWYDTIFWLKNDGTGQFSNPTTVNGFSFNFQTSGFECSDIDNDGDSDVIAFAANNDLVRWYENDGAGNFLGFHVISSAFDAPAKIIPVDIDLDGDNDILSFGAYNHEIVWFENTGGGLFNTQAILATNQNLVSPGLLFVEDIDNDGLLDILISCVNNDEISWYKNLGSMLFSPAQIISTTIDNNRIQPIDFDNDGDIDIVASENVLMAERILWLENSGGGTFSNDGPTLQSGSGNVAGSYFESADMDLDGDSDIINPGGGQNSSIWFLENSWAGLTIAKGRIYFDYNENNTFDSTDFPVTTMQVTSTPLSNYSFTDNNGLYTMGFSNLQSAYNLFPQLLPQWSITTDSSSYLVAVDSSFTLMDSLDFGIYPSIIMDSLSADITGGLARCNNVVNYWLNIRNLGTTIIDGKIELHLDTSITFVSASLPHDSIIGNTVYWSYEDLSFFDYTLIKCTVQMPDFNSIGDTLQSLVYATIIDSSDQIIFSSSDTLDQILTCAYDPNDKVAQPTGYGTQGYVSSQTSSFEYTIRFQNTGNDTAQNVVIKDYLDSDLLWTSFTPIAYSHPVNITMDPTSGLVTFSFEGIMLPDSTTDYLGSQGFVKYRIDLYSGLAAQTIIQNNAEIYFDQNPPILTNTTYHTIYDCSSMWDNFTLDDTVYLCQNDSLYYEGDQGFTTYSWSHNGGLTQSFGSSFLWQPDTTGFITMELTANNPVCFDELILPLNILDTHGPDPTETHICEGDSILLFGTFQNYSGIYYDTLQSLYGCDSIISVELIVYNSPLVNIGSLNQEFCLNAPDFILTEGTPLGGTYSGTGVVNNLFSPSSAGLGVHTVIYAYSDANGCFGYDSTYITVHECVSISMNEPFSYSVSPNPFNDDCKVTFSEDLNGKYLVRLLDMLGNVVRDFGYPQQNVLHIDGQGLSKGVYFLNFKGDTLDLQRLIKL